MVFANIQILRAIACINVVIAHSVYSATSNNFNSSFPIDKIDHKEMVGLRWWSPGMHPEGKWISKSKPVSPRYGKLTQEAWAEDGGTFDHFYDYEAKLESANSPGVNKSTKEAIMWRNEHSADAWIFEAPFGCNKNHKIR